jgi:hypothetical protein
MTEINSSNISKAIIAESLAYLQMNKSDEAIKAFDRVIRLDPRSAYVGWAGKRMALNKLGLPSMFRVFYFEEGPRETPRLNAKTWKIRSTMRSGENGSERMSKFPLGKVVATPGALEILENEGIWPCIARHSQCNLGDLNEADRKENELSLKPGYRLLSSYNLPSGERIWIITETDRSSTCILLPSEY